MIKLDKISDSHSTFISSYPPLQGEGQGGDGVTE